MTNTIYSNPILLQKYNIDNIRWDQKKNVDQNGLFQVFLMNSDVLFVNKPDGYNAKRVEELLANKVNSEIISKRSLPDNVIVIMNESFFDLGVIDPSFYRFDFMPYTRDIMNRYYSGNTIVPVIGGGTCNTEFEFLTGFFYVFFAVRVITISAVCTRICSIHCNCVQKFRL
jgi:hypothetical protein